MKDNICGGNTWLQKTVSYERQEKAEMKIGVEYEQNFGN